ncbi:hypothetical protein BJX64DRAFT_295612 [Aspergillus heterothallicus]
MAAILASQQEFPRRQLASWDASARAWLQTADKVKRLQQTQLMLIINNLQLPVNVKNDPYESVMTAWTSALSSMEKLVRGVSQRVMDGAILLAIASWHLYPDMEVLTDEVISVEQKDKLMNKAILTVSKKGSYGKDGVFWSLPLAQMRYYSPPVISERYIASNASRVSMQELCIIILGIIIAQWRDSCPDVHKCCNLIIHLARLVAL